MWEVAVSRQVPEVVVVDDDRGVREALLRGLSLEGFRVREAADGKLALVEIAARPPAVVVLDVVMPGLSGVEVVRLLLAMARHSGQVLNRAQLLARVWGYTWDVDSNVVDVFIGYLRKKLEAAGESRVLHTVRGVGFVLRV